MRGCFFVARNMREFARQFYHSKEWIKTREYILKRDKYLCVMCGNPAQEVHHLEHISPKNIDDPRITMNPDNLVSLCRDCHFNMHKGEHGKGRASKEKEEESEYIFDENGYLVKR